MVGSERVYQTGQHFYVGYDRGRQMVAELIQPESSVPPVPTFGGIPLDQSGEPSVPPRNSEQPGESSGSQRPPEPPNPGRTSVPESPAPGRPFPSPLGSGQADSRGQPGHGPPEQSRSTSPQAIAHDEKVFARYFTRGSQGAGEADRANVLREMERGNLEMGGPADHKEKWTGQNVTPPLLPQVPTSEKEQVHVRTLLERWESRFILHFNTISPRAGLYAKAVIAGVWKWLEIY
eukprot:474867-Amphidinium_carterae.1